MYGVPIGDYLRIPGYWLDVTGPTCVRWFSGGESRDRGMRWSAVTRKHARHTQSEYERPCKYNIIIYDNIILRYNGTLARVLLYRLQMRRRQMTLGVCFIFFILFASPNGPNRYDNYIYARIPVPELLSFLLFIFFFVIYIGSIWNREFLALLALQKNIIYMNIHLYTLPIIYIYIPIICVLSSCH